MRPCPAEAAADACEEMAGLLERETRVDERRRAASARAVDWVPNCHPLRFGDDRCGLTARALEAGTATAEELRAFAAEMRAGAKVMNSPERWWGLFYGPESMDAKGES